MSEKKWIGSVPVLCDTCKTPIRNKFYDAATRLGCWAIMCPSCQEFGPGLARLGSGRGQEYTLTSGQWPKTGG